MSNHPKAHLFIHLIIITFILGLCFYLTNSPLSAAAFAKDPNPDGWRSRISGYAFDCNDKPIKDAYIGMVKDYGKGYIIRDETISDENGFWLISTKDVHNFGIVAGIDAHHFPGQNYFSRIDSPHLNGKWGQRITCEDADCNFTSVNSNPPYNIPDRNFYYVGRNWSDEKFEDHFYSSRDDKYAKNFNFKIVANEQGAPCTPPTPVVYSSLQNSSFESGNYNHWHVSNGMNTSYTHVVDAEKWGGSRHGRYFAKLTRNVGDAYVASDWFDAGENVSEKTFKIQFEIKSHSSPDLIKNFLIQRHPKGSDWSQGGAYIPEFNINTNWQTKTAYLTFPNPTNGNTSSQIRVVLRPASTNQATYYDNVRIIKSDRPTNPQDIDKDGDIDWVDLSLLSTRFASFNIFSMAKLINNF